MSIKHSKQIARPDGRDPTQVQPSDWNAEHVIDGGIELPLEAAVPVPEPGKAILYASAGVGLPRVFMRGEVGPPYPLALSWARRMPRFVSARGGVTGLTTWGLGTSAVGTASAVATAGGSGLKGAAHVLRYTTAAATPNVFAGWRSNTLNFLRGGSSIFSGFYFAARFGIDTYDTQSHFHSGFRATAAAPSTPIASMTNVLLAGFEPGDLNFSFFYRDTASAMAKVSTGIAINISNLFLFEMGAAPGDETVKMQFTDLSAGLVSTLDAASPIPSATQLLAPHMHIGNGASGSSAAFSFSSVFIETDY